MNKSSQTRLLLSILLFLVIWFSPAPMGVTSQAWHLFAIFLATIAIVVSEALPMGAGTLLGLTAAVSTKTMPFNDAFVGYTDEITWLVAMAFFIAHGLIKSGLGHRIAYMFVAFMGKSTLGLAYGISFTELLLSPAIPSVTARSGGIIYPIVKSLADALDSKVENKTEKRIGTYLMLVAFQISIVTSAMFLTAMAANPIAAKLAGEVHVNLSWGTWALAAIVPGLVSIILIPLIIYKIMPPELKDTSHASFVARENLKTMGRVSRNERLTIVVFLGLLTLWIGGDYFGVSAAVAALLGLCFMIVLDVVTWDEILHQAKAWETFIWFGGLLALAKGLNQYGLTTWFGKWAASYMESMPWMLAFILLFLLYFYIHYFFASATAHVSALFLPFVVVVVNLGAPPLFVALLFAFASNLFGGLTHYGFGPAPILFGAGYVSLKDWWRVGFLISVVNIAIWGVVGSIWWKTIGLF